MSVYKVFRENPVCPCGDFPWQKYYWRRPPAGLQFEGDYWGKVVDPDGKERDPLQEKEQKIADQRAEVDFVNRLNPGRILDVGCGPGFTLSGVNQEWQKFGTELSQVASLYARQYGTIFLGELTGAGYETGIFDVVMMIHVLRYVQDPIGYVKEVRRVLKPGGYFVLSEADYDSACARRFKYRYRLLHDKGVINLFTAFSLVRLLEDMGFAISKVEYPFFETRWFTKANLLRLLDQEDISPPCYGNFVTVYAIKE